MNKIQDTQPVRPLMGNERSIIEGEQAEAAASSEEAFSGRAGASNGESLREEMDRLQREDESVKRMRREAAESEASPSPAGGQEPTLTDSDDDEMEARRPRVLRDPGAPTEEQIEEHNTNHLPFRSWCPACVAGKAKDKFHSKIKDEEHGIPTVVFDYCFLATNDVKDTIPTQVMLDTRTQMLFGHVVPRKGMIDEHGCEQMIKDLEKLGYDEIILKCDEEPALLNIQDSVVKRRQRKTIPENSPVGDSQANGKAERAVQTLCAHVRVLKKGLENRCKKTFSSDHPIITWLVEHAADVVSRYQVGRDGHTAYERWKGKRFRGEAVEFGELVHYKYTKRDKNKKLEMKWDEGIYLGRDWRTNESFVALQDGVKRAGTIRRVGGHRRWDPELLSKVSCVPWKMKRDADDPNSDGLVREQTDEEKSAEVEARDKHEPHLRMKLLREDFFEHGFTDGCKGCKAIVSKASAQAHSERCRQRMEKLLVDTEKGATRKRKAVDKENQWIASKMESKQKSHDRLVGIIAELRERI